MGTLKNLSSIREAGMLRLTDGKASGARDLGHRDVVIHVNIIKDGIKNTIIGEDVLVGHLQEPVHHQVQLRPVGAEEADAGDG